MADNTARVAIEHSWPMGHRLQRHLGRCHYVHGHTYRMRAVFEGIVWKADLEIMTEAMASNDGMVADFGLLKQRIRQELEHLDHGMALEESDPLVPRLRADSRLVLLPDAPTAENLAGLLLRLMQPVAEAAGARCISVTLWESDTTYAEVQA